MHLTMNYGGYSKSVIPDRSLFGQCIDCICDRNEDLVNVSCS